MKRKTLVFVCLLVIALMVASTVPVGAKKPPPKPDLTPSGTLYYTYPDSGSHYVWSMDADGTDKTKEHSWKGEYYSMSRSQHGGDWWYVGWKAVGGSYPDGEPRWEIFAVSDDGNTEVQLTDNANMEMNRLGIKPVWGLEDDTVTWSAVVWDQDASGNDYYVESGIYQADVNWDSGAVTDIGTIWKVVGCGYSNYGSDTYYANARETLDWSPDGKNIVYAKWDTVDKVIKVFIYELATETETELVAGYHPQWSPDGNYIAFGKDRSLFIIKPDGTGKTTLAIASYKGKTRETIEHHHWAPDSKFLMYRSFKINYARFGMWYTDIYVIDMEGNRDCVTSSLTDTDWKDTVGWR